jgi:hypothetical protein
LWDLPEFQPQGIEGAAARTAAQAFPVAFDKVNAEVGLTTFSSAIFVSVEGAPEDCPIAMAFHSNRRTENFFCGGQDVVHEFFFELLSVQEYHNRVNTALACEAVDRGFQRQEKPVMRLACGNGNQDEKYREGSHDHAPFWKELNVFQGNS